MSRSPYSHGPALIILFFTFGTVMLDRMILVFLGPHLVKSMGLTPGQIGLLASVSGICWAISSLIFGAVSDRIGRRKVLIPAVVLFSLSSWLSGFAENFTQLMLARILLGIAEGPCWSVIMALVEETSAKERRGRNIGVVNSAGPLFGAAIAPIFATQVAEHLNWQWAFFVAGIPGLILAVLIFLYVKESATKPVPAASSHKFSFREYAQLLKYRNLLLCAMGAIGLATWLHVFSAFAPLYITEVMQQTPTTAGFLLGAAGFGGFLWSFFGTRIADHYGRKKAAILFSALCLFKPLLFMIAPLYDWPWVLAGMSALVMAGPAAAAIIIILIPAETVPRRFTAAAIGFAGIGTELIGATFSPALGGIMAEAYGLSAPIIFASCGAALMLIACMLVRETMPSSSRENRAPVLEGAP